MTAMDTEQAIPAHCGYRHDVGGAMLKRIALATTLLICAPMTVLAKVSLVNIRQPEAAVEEKLIEAEHGPIDESMAPIEHCRSRDSETRAAVSDKLDKTSEPACTASGTPAARPSPAQSAGAR
jgi:hypothetical protein